MNSIAGLEIRSGPHFFGDSRLTLTGNCCERANASPRTKANGKQRKVERAMEIEPKRTAPQSLWNAAFSDSEKAACDWRANFRVMKGN